MIPMRANIVGPPNSTTSVRHSIAVCHSASGHQAAPSDRRSDASKTKFNLNGGYGWLEGRCKARASLPLDAIRHSHVPPI